MATKTVVENPRRPSRFIKLTDKQFDEVMQLHELTGIPLGVIKRAIARYMEKQFPPVHQLLRLYLEDIVDREILKRVSEPRESPVVMVDGRVEANERIKKMAPPPRMPSVSIAKELAKED